MIKWRQARSTEKPTEIDITSSKTTIYLRRNIIKTFSSDETASNSYVFYEYEEAKLTKKEYEEYKQVSEMINARQMRADLDYIALCTGINLEV